MRLQQLKLNKDMKSQHTINRNITNGCYNCEYHIEFFDMNLMRITCMCCNLEVKDDNFHYHNCLGYGEKEIKECIGWENKIDV